MDKDQNETVLEQLKRIKKVYDIHTDKAVGDKLGKDKNTISGWKKRGNIPTDVFKKISIDESVSMDWLSTGKGSMRSTSSGEMLDTVSMLGGLFSDERSIKIVQLLPYAPKEFLDQLVERLETFKKLSSI